MKKNAISFHHMHQQAENFGQPVEAMQNEYAAAGESDLEAIR